MAEGLRQNGRVVAVICDCHNTLIYSHEAWIDAFGVLGGDEVRDAVRSGLFAGRPRRELAAELGIDFNVLVGYARERSVADDSLVGLLREWKAAGAFLALVSNAERERVLSDLEAVGLSGFFELVFTREDGGKQSVDVFETVLEKAGVSTALYIGNDPAEDHINHPRVVSVVKTSFLRAREAALSTRTRPGP